MTEEMPLLSRRSFLQMAGIAAASTRFLSFAPLLNRTSALAGRPFEALPVLTAPYADAPVVAHLWPDSMVPIQDTAGDWYAVPGGYVPRSGMQPMPPYRPEKDIAMPEQPFWAEVAAPVASVREYAAANAPLMTRIGHGGVLHVVDALPDRGGFAGWYAVSETDGYVLGWTQAVLWRPVTNAVNQPTDEARLSIDRQASRLTLKQDKQTLLSAPFSAGTALQPGDYTVSERQIGGGRYGVYRGLPWRVTLDAGHDLAGVYWHNGFGAPAPGPAVQLPPLVAASLFGWLSESTKVSIR
jgi:hypothetical protein